MLQRSVNEWVSVYIVMKGCMLLEKKPHNDARGKKKKKKTCRNNEPSYRFVCSNAPHSYGMI